MENKDTIYNVYEIFLRQVPGWLWTYYLVKAGLELMFHLPLPSEYKDYSHVPSCLDEMVLEIALLILI